MTFTVYVTVADGLYYIKNAASGLYLQDSDNLARIFATKTGQTQRLPQLWKITYISYGNYSIRPIQDLSRALYVLPSGSVGTNAAAISDANIASTAKWQIRHNEYGYAFLQGGLTSKAMTPIGTSSNSVVNSKAWSASTSCHWELEKANGIFIRDTTTLQTIDTSTAKTVELGLTYTLADLGKGWEYYGSLMGVVWFSSRNSVISVDQSGTMNAKDSGEAVITLRATVNGIQYTQSYKLRVPSTDPFHYTNIQYIRYIRIADTSQINPNIKVDHTISIVKSSLLADEYCIILDNIYVGYYRCIYIDNALKNTLTSLEEGYHEHYHDIPALDTATEQEKASYYGKVFTDNLVTEGYFAHDSSEYWGIWAFNYVSTLNIFEYWQGVLNTATKAYGVYLAATSFYYSYLFTTNTIATSINSAQYNTTATYIDDIDDILTTIGYTNKNVISAEARNEALGYSNPPYEPGTPVVGYETTQTTQYVRVYTDGITNPSGRWVMKYSDIEGLTASQIKDKFALQNTPTHYCFVNVPSGVQMYTGIASEIPGWGTGGGLQFEIIDYLTSWFGNGIPLP